MDLQQLITVIGIANLLALGGLIFKAGAIVNSITQQDEQLHEMNTGLNSLSQEVNTLSQRVSHLEGVVRRGGRGV